MPDYNYTEQIISNAALAKQLHELLQKLSDSITGDETEPNDLADPQNIPEFLLDTDFHLKHSLDIVANLIDKFYRHDFDNNI